MKNIMRLKVSWLTPQFIITMVSVVVMVVGALIVEAGWKGKIEERINNNIVADNKREERLLKVIEELKEASKENTKAINNLNHNVEIIRIYVEKANGVTNNYKDNHPLIRKNK